MFTKKVFATVVFASLALAGPASADWVVGGPALDGGLLNVRTGPGQDYNIILSIPEGTNGISVYGCIWPNDGISRYQFCRIRWGSVDGWVSRNGLVYVRD